MKLKKDIVTKDIIKEIARDISTYMLDIKLSDEITLIDKEFTRVEKRDSDIVFINGADKIVHIEIQNDHHIFNNFLIYFKQTIKESTMQVALNLGTINITNQEVGKFIQNRSIDEIKSMITDFLTNQANLISTKPTEKKGKWAKVADEMRGTMSTDTVEYLKSCSQEIRSGFELRDLK